MADYFILDDIPFKIELDQLAKTLRVKEGSEQRAKLKNFIADAQALAKPKVVYKIAYIEAKEEDSVLVEGVTFASRILRVNLEKAHRTFPYVATCGQELERWSGPVEDLLERYWADVIKETAVRLAVKYLSAYLQERYRPGKLSRMNPGSLPDWPLPEQRPLFTLLGDGPASIGVKLTDSFLMIPIKSVSGIFFPTEESFESCQLCSREKCSGRRAPYDSGLYNRKYQPR